MFIEAVASEQELKTLLRRSAETPDQPIGQVLLQRMQVITPRVLTSALEAQKACPRQRIGQILLSRGAISETWLNIALALRLGIPYISLDRLEIATEVLGRMPAGIAFRYQVMPLAEDAGSLIVAVVNPLSRQTIDAIGFHAACKIRVVMAASKDIMMALSKYYTKFDEDQALEEYRLRPAEGAAEQDRMAREGRQTFELEATRRPIVRLLNAIVTHGLVSGASDINIRPEQDRFDVYYRIDGRLHRSRTFDRALLPGLVSRIKIIGRMNIAERRIPQEGNARLDRGGQRVDLRLSVLPTSSGESVVIRILDEAIGLRPLSGLGIPLPIQEILLCQLHRPHGLFLVTGPTGSGKSTTLYALINELRETQAHILTIEDPVEYRMEGIEQVQVDETIGTGFASTLKRFMRHDPDVIMVGEIRDRETAAIAIQAALTGHLVLSTLHTNDAPGAVTRLMDMGVAPYLISGTLLAVLAERLIRINCTACSREEPMNEKQRRTLPEALRRFFSEEAVIKSGQGCSQCRHTGFDGRQLACELMINTPAMSRLISSSPATEDIRRLAVSEGWRPLSHHAAELARAGKTTLAEITSISGV